MNATQTTLTTLRNTVKNAGMLCIGRGKEDRYEIMADARKAQAELERIEAELLEEEAEMFEYSRMIEA